MEQILKIKDFRKEESECSVHDNPRETVDIAYAAGIIDGEGAITIIKTQAKGRDKAAKYEPRLVVHMVDCEVPTFLRDLFGGQIYQRAQKQENWRSTTQWVLQKKDLLYSALNQMLPYLKTKRLQAKVAIAFLEECSFYRRGRARVPVNELLKREDFRQSMKKLNLRGVPATTKRVGSREAEAIV